MGGITLKKFLEELNKSKDIYTDIPVSTGANLRYKQMKDLYSKHIGGRALYTDKIEKESRVVYIEQVTDSFIIAKYNCYGMDYTRQVSACVMYSSIICGDARVEIE